MSITTSADGAKALKTQFTSAETAGKLNSDNPKVAGAVLDNIEATLADQGLYGDGYEDSLKMLEASPSAKDHEIAKAFRKRDAERAKAMGTATPAKTDPFKDPAVAPGSAQESFFSTCMPSKAPPGWIANAMLFATNETEASSGTKTPTQPPLHSCEEGPDVRGQIAFKSFGTPLYGVYGHPSGSDVKQNHMGDCWFAASLSGLAQRNPKAVEKMITDNHNGTYTVHIYVPDAKGKPVMHDVLVDDKFPVHADKPGEAMYSSANPMWYALIEKAYAKELGGYQYLANNSSFNIDPCFGATGKAELTVDPAKVSAHTLFLGCSAVKNTGTVSTTGSASPLVSNHVYTIVGTYTKDGKEYVKLRNPWGTVADIDIEASKLKPLIHAVTVG